MLIIAILFWIIAVVLVAVGIGSRSGWFIGGGVLSALIGFMFLIFSTFYTIEPGEAKVLKNWTGEIIGSEQTVGAHWKDPWVDAIDFDVRNQIVSYIGNGEQQYGNQPTTGPQITFTDKDGVTANMDLAILYSINPNVVEGLVEDYTTQQDFATKVIEQDARSVPREVPGRFTTIQMLTDRTAVAAAIRELLELEWEPKGIIIEDVSLQEIRYSDAVQQRFEDAQNAQTEVVKAQADAERARIAAEGEADAAIAKATGEAEANRILDASLTEKILRSRYIEAITGANLIVVPEDFTALGNIQ